MVTWNRCAQPHGDGTGWGIVLPVGFACDVSATYRDGYGSQGQCHVSVGSGIVVPRPDDGRTDIDPAVYSRDGTWWWCSRRWGVVVLVLVGGRSRDPDEARREALAVFAVFSRRIPRIVEVSTGKGARPPCARCCCCLVLTAQLLCSCVVFAMDVPVCVL